MHAVGADQEVARHSCPARKDRSDAAVVLNNIFELHARPITGIRQLPPQRPIEQRPGRENFIERQPRDHRAIVPEAKAHGERDADRLVDGNAKPAHDLEHFDMRADADAAAGEVAGAALEHRHLPAGLAQQKAGEQAAERTADDQCATHRIRSGCLDPRNFLLYLAND